MTEQRLSALIDVVDYYWNLSDEHELNDKQREHLTESMNELSTGGEVAQEWATVAKEILTK